MCNETPSLLDLMKQYRDFYSPQELCRLSGEQREHYSDHLAHVKSVNSSKCSDRIKGAALEELVAYLLQISGGIFKVLKNVRTSTNEIDQLVTLNENGRPFLGLQLISPRLGNFIGECKNYSGAVDVTYVGKFYSLLLTTGINTGILFTYHGVTGTGWTNGNGLIKKAYLQRELDEHRVAIIVFSVTDYERIQNGENFISLVEEKLFALKTDTDISQYISSHEAETVFLGQA